jgi:biopolymer transport protein ExbD
MTQAAHANAEPIGAINVTPFIDVLLVLMIMIILTIPIQSHKVPIDLPTPGVPPPTTPLSHELAIERGGALIWDGQRIADAALPGLLANVAADDRTELHLRTDPETRYERFDTVLSMVKRANITRLGFIGNETMKD